MQPNTVKFFGERDMSHKLMTDLQEPTTGRLWISETLGDTDFPAVGNKVLVKTEAGAEISILVEGVVAAAIKGAVSSFGPVPVERVGALRRGDLVEFEERFVRCIFRTD